MSDFVQDLSQFAEEVDFNEIERIEVRKIHSKILGISLSSDVAYNTLSFLSRSLAAVASVRYSKPGGMTSTWL